MDGPLAVQAEIAGSISRREECESSILLVSGNISSHQIQAYLVNK